jgi:hypothetical protein
MSAITSAQVRAQWIRHRCASPSGLCDCRFDYVCPSCGGQVVARGKDIPMLLLSDGWCASCCAGDTTTTPVEDAGGESFDAFLLRTGAAQALAQDDLAWQAGLGYDGLDEEQIQQLMRSRRL